MTKKTAYIVIVKEPDMDAYAISDASYNLERMQQIMQHRAEELIDEAVSEDENCDLILEVLPDRMAARVFRETDDEGNTADVAVFTISAIELDEE